MRTLKLDWTAERIEAVLGVLDHLSLSREQAEVIREDLSFFRGVSATLKLDWPSDLINALVEGMDAVASDEIRAAAREIRDYRQAVADVKRYEIAADE